MKKRLLCSVLCAAGALSSAAAFVQQATTSGASLHWTSFPISFRVNARGTTDVPNAAGADEFAAVQSAFNSWGVANSAVAFANAGTTTAEVNTTDGINTVVWIEDPEAKNDQGQLVLVRPDLVARTRVRSDAATGTINESDIALNGLNFRWDVSGSDAFTSISGPHDVQSVLTHEIGHLLGLDHVTTPGSALYVTNYPGDTSWRTLPQDEVSATQAIYPSASPPPESSISGRITRGSNGVPRAYVLAMQSGSPVVGAMADASGNYRIRRVPPGTYVVRVQPYSTAGSVTFSAYYRSSTNVDVNFLATYRPGPNSGDEAASPAVVVTSGSDTPGVNLAVSTSGQENDPYEDDDTSATAKSIALDGKAQLHHAWPGSPSADLDWVKFTATSNRLYVIETKNLGLQKDDSSLDSATVLDLYDQTGGGTPLATNVSPNDREQSTRSRIAWYATASGQRFVRVRQRTPSNSGAGVYFDVATTEIASVPTPAVSSIGPGAGLASGGYYVVVRGTNFAPGAEVQFGGVDATEEDVQDCVSPASCQSIKVRVPAHASGQVTVEVRNPPAATGPVGSLANGFEYLAARAGTFSDFTVDAFGANQGNGLAVCYGDFDNDGDPDLFRATTSAAGTTRRLYRNNGDFTYTDITATAGLTSTCISNTASCAWADYDDDNDLDLYLVCGGVGASNKLFQNQINTGSASFVDVTSTAAVAGTVSGSKTDAAWADYDLDGDLDLLLTMGSSTAPNQLFQNNKRNGGTGTFVDVGAAAGVAQQTTGSRVLWTDYDRDGHDDFYVVNRSSQPDALYHNNRNGTFSIVTVTAGLSEAANCYDAVWADFNADQFPDLFCVGDTLGTVEPQRLWINNRNGTFTDRAAGGGVADVNRFGTAVAALDRDNDGDMDIYLGASQGSIDMLLDNNGASPPMFSDVAVSVGVDETAFPRNAYGIAVADDDGDGDADAYVTGDDPSLSDSDYLWGNTSNTNQGLVVRLRGVVSNSWGIGVQVTVIPSVSGSPTESLCLSSETAANARRQEVIGGSHSQGSIELEFGLGSRPVEARDVDCVNVFWPRSGLRRSYVNVATDQIISITENAPTLTVTRVDPAFGPTAGGNPVTVYGFNFLPTAQVYFRGVAATVTGREGSTIIRVTAPANPAGLASVEVRNSTIDTATLVDAYTYTADAITLTVTKDGPANAVVLTWTDVASGSYYRVKRALGPQPGAFNPAQLCTIVTNRTYSDSGVLNNGVNLFYLVDSTPTCP